MRYRLTLTIILAFLFEFSNTLAQIVLEKEYQLQYLAKTNLGDGTFVYYGFNNQSSGIEIYDESHQYLKTIALDTIKYNKSILYISRNLFNTDEKIEFMATYLSDANKSFAILNEDGDEILSRPKYYGWAIYPGTENARVIEGYYEPGQPRTIKVYRLPGQLALATGQKGVQGEKGDKGDMPAHEWNGTRLRFEKPDGSWGEYVDLQGATGQAPPHEWNGTRLRFEKPDGSWGEYVDLQGATGQAPPHEWNSSELRFQNPDGSWGAYTDLLGPQGEKGVCDCEQENGKVTNTRANVIKEAIISNPMPNPSNTHTFINYHLPPGTAEGELAIFNSTGRLIKILALTSASGDQKILTSELATGIYYYRLELSQGVSEMKRLVINR